MAQPPLDPQKRDEVLRLKAKGYTHQQVADMAGVGLGTVSKVVNQRPRESSRIDEYAEYHREKFLELRERYHTWIGDTEKVKAPKRKAGKRVKAFCINDIHAPFHKEELLAKAIRDNKDADECWIVGDFLDLFAFARYPKYQRRFSPIEEFQSGQAVLNILSETFPVVRALHGNHDQRMLKYLVRDKGIPADIIEFFQFVYPEFPSPLSKMCSAFPNVQMMEPKHIDYANYSYIHQIGDCVLSHAEKFSAVPGKTPGDVLRRIQEKLVPMGVVSRDFRVLAQAHTHCAGKIWGDYGVVTIEMGCMASVPDYDGDARISGRAPVTGYTVLVQENGVTDVNSSNFVELR